MPPSRPTRTAQTSRIFRIRGQKSLYYPNERLGPEDCTLLENVRKTAQQGTGRRLGYTKFNSSQMSESSTAKPAVGMVQHNFIAGRQIVVVSGTKIYAVATNGASSKKDIVGSLTLTDSANNFYRFAVIDDKIFATNDVDETWYWAGDYATPTAAVALTGMQWTTCRELVTHRNLLVALNTYESGVRRSTRIRWCDVDKYTLTNINVASWPSNHVYDLYEDGPAIVAAADAYGYLIVLKEDGVYPFRLEYQNGLIYMNVLEENVRRGFEPIAKCSVRTHPAFGVWVIARDGAYVIDSGFNFRLVTRGVQDTWNDLNHSRLQYAVSWVRSREHQVVTLLSDSGNTSGHDRIMVWDWLEDEVWFDDPAVNMNYGIEYVQVSDSDLFDLMGDVNGYIQKGNTGNTDDSTDIRYTVHMAPNDLGYPGRLKTFVTLKTILVREAGVKSVDLTVDIDEGETDTRQGSLSVGSSLSYDSGLQYDSGLEYPGGTTEVAEFFVNRLGNTISPRWQGTSAVNFVGYQIKYQVEE